MTRPNGLSVFHLPAITHIINFFFPPLCVHCGREDGWLCSAARLTLTKEKPLVNPLSIPGVDRVIVRGSYDCEPLAQFIQKLKYHYWTGSTEILTDILTPLSSNLHRFTRLVIVPVPLHRRRHQERGFNQSLYISRALSDMTGLPVNNLLRRTRYTAPQAQLSAKERTTNIVGAFGRKAVAKWPKSVILVDDVITTGSTMAECASVLRQHGVREITAVAIAKG